MKMRSFMRFPGGHAKVLTLSYDDGIEQDKRLVKILDKYGIKATFNINSGLYAAEDMNHAGKTTGRMTHEDTVALFKDSGHEVAVHSYSHPFLEALPPAMATYEIITDRQNLEADYGVPIRGMAYPFGTYNDSVVEIIKNAGIVYARTVIATKKFKLPSDWLRLETTCHHSDESLMKLAERFTKSKVDANPRMFYLWGHSYEFDDNDNWNVIEEFCEFMSGRDDIWYATNIEIYDYVKAYESLIWSFDMSMVKNPTATTLYVEVSKHGEPHRILEIGPGQSIKTDL